MNWTSWIQLTPHSTVIPNIPGNRLSWKKAQKHFSTQWTSFQTHWSANPPLSLSMSSSYSQQMKKERLERIGDVLQFLENAGITIKLKNCCLLSKTVEYFGYVIALDSYTWHKRWLKQSKCYDTQLWCQKCFFTVSLYCIQSVRTEFCITGLTLQTKANTKSALITWTEKHGTRRSGRTQWKNSHSARFSTAATI